MNSSWFGFNQAKRILEIGVFASTTTVALALLPFVDKIVACDIEPYLVEFAKPFYEQAKVTDKIDFRIGDAIKTLEDIESKGQGFDLVFIDADKGGYWGYYDKIMSSKVLLNPDGVIIAVSFSAALHCYLFTNNLFTFWLLRITQDNTIYKASTFVPHEAFAEGAKALGEFNRKVKEDPRSEVVVLPARDGISIIRRTQQ